MSVLIKGMEMPTRCWDCLLNTHGYCMASEHSDIIPSDAPIPNWCPLIEIPPHGRLIDADALMEQLNISDSTIDCAGCKHLGNYGCESDAWAMVCSEFMDAPTIIEGDKE